MLLLLLSEAQSLQEAEKILNMKECPFGNMVAGSHLICLQAQNQTPGFHGSWDAAIREVLQCMVLHVNVTSSVAWHTRAGGRGRAFPDGGWLLDKLS